MQIEGQPPDMRIPPVGCPFFMRCPYRIEGLCDDQMPPLIPGPESSEAHIKACWVDVRTGKPLTDDIPVTVQAEVQHV